MPSPMHEPHRFACHAVWSGGARGPTTSYASYSREHRIEMEGKPTLVLSAAPAFRGDASLHNPEDLLVAALASCHMLSYLALTAMGGIAVIAYEDDATGTMQNVDGTMRFTEVTLRPRVVVAPGTDVERARALHEKAHSGCFIASSVNFPVTNEPTIVLEGTG